MWYKQWFNTPYYHMLYRNRDAGEAGAFIDILFKYLNPKKEEWILDLGCGKGRHSIHINKLGYKVEGADISEQNIAYASAFENEGLRFTLHDMREPLRHQAFGLVLNLFTSFGYFDDMEENKQVIKASHHNLLPKGRMLIDYLNVDYVARHLVPQEEVEIDGVHFRISRSIEHDVIIKRIEVHDKGVHLRFEEHVKAIDKQQFCGMLAQTGFEVLELFGNYKLDQFNTTNSPRLIIAARRKS